MIDTKRSIKKVRLTAVFAIVVFFILILPTVFSFINFFIMHELGIRPVAGHHKRTSLFMLVIISLSIGAAFTFVFSYMFIKPIRTLEKAADKIAEGDYSVRVSLNGMEEFKQLGERFNHMAEELGSVEMLKSDFVNNFSHEFKTPIVSLRGFAKMLKNDDLTAEEKSEYLNIIIDESERLAEPSPSILNLSRLEQQTILTDKTRFNVSEQIRLVIAMLDSKWHTKNIDFTFEDKDIFINANREMLEQVWINLIDNAIKFSGEKGKVAIQIDENEAEVSVKIKNYGAYITPDKSPHIFEKFYQGDFSRTTKGNGLGLSIVKEIMELHKGKVKLLESGENGTVFEVVLSA